MGSFCAKCEILHGKTIPRVLQLSNVTERMSRTIIRSVILRTTQLLESFRGEGNDTASYLINISPSIPLNFGLLRRVWARKDISCSHLKGIWMQILLSRG